MNKPVLPQLPLSSLFTAFLFAASLVFAAPPSKAQTRPAKAGIAKAAVDDQLFRVTIRPRPRIGAPPDLQEMVIRSADGSVMFFVEWLLRPKTGSATGAYGDYDQSYFDIGKPVKEDLSLRYRMSGKGDFATSLGRRYLGLSFDEIAQLVGYQPTVLEARFDAGRGLYQTASAAGPYEPLYSTFGKFNFENIPCNPWVGLICGAFNAR